MKGFTLVELVVAIIVFFLFLAGIYATLDVGLKSWQIGEVKAGLQQSGEVAMKRLVGELISSNNVSLQIDPDNSYIAFETAVSPADGEFKRDISDLGTPEWQAHIVYYALPDPEDSSSFVLYRNYKDRDAINTIPRKLSSLEIGYLCDPNNTTYNMNNKILARNLEGISFEKNNAVITITFTYKKHIRSNADVAFSPGGDSEKGVEHFEIKSSVEPRN